MTCSPSQKLSLSWNSVALSVVFSSNGCHCVQLRPKLAEYRIMSAPHALWVNVYELPDTLNAELS